MPKLTHPKQMTVGQLINRLSKYDPNHTISISKSPGDSWAWGVRKIAKHPENRKVVVITANG